MNDKPVPPLVHDQTLGELAADLRGLKEVFAERDRSTREQFQASKDAVAAALAAAEKAVEAALTAAKELTAATFTASEKAISKAEEAQTRTNISQDEFRAQLKDQAATLMPRSETEQRFSQLTAGLAELREAYNQSAGVHVGQRLSGNILAIVLTLLIALAGVIVTIIVKF